MNGLSLRRSITPGSDGPGDGPAAIRLGFAAEPIVDLAYDHAPPLYSECLARMMVAETVLLRGGDFVPDLERNDEVGLLDAAMVGLVLETLSEELPFHHLGCNISPRTLADPNAWRAVLDRLSARPWLTARLTLEITETGPLDEIAGAAGRLMAARNLGCRLAIDDFGAGFATSTRLGHLDIPWDVVKLDRRCLGDPRQCPDAHERLNYYLSLAGGLAPFVVVEGIETQAHLTAARAAGALYGQGWLFEGPVEGRWSVPDADTGARLTAAMMAHGAILRPVAVSPVVAERAHGGRRYLLSRVDRLSDRVRALVIRAAAGGAA